ncbi:MAG: DinB family protein [Dehalococcoidales bacterium]|nr:DinB family protein [Dehalococcoidales bacterium]
MKEIRESVRSEYESARSAFHTLLGSLSEEDLKAKSNNPGWTNGEILFHVTLGFHVLLALLPMARFFAHLPKIFSRLFAGLLNSMTWFFNPVNAAGTRGGSKIYRRHNIGRKFDRVIDSLLKKLASVKETEWQMGMYYPTKWDPLFDQFMTLEKLFHYPVIHFNFHLKQISSGRKVLL